MTQYRAFLAGLAVAGAVTAGVAAFPSSSTARDTSSHTSASQPAALPADADNALARLNASPRHGEWATIVNGADTVKAWVVYPERSEKAPVVLVVHEIFGLTHWIRGVADQLAAEGFIAIAPDLMTMKHLPEGPNGPDQQAATTAIRTLNPADVQRHLDQVARYGMALPAALPVYGVVGFCWGGSTSFNHAVHAPGLGASVVYYGSSPATETLATVKAPVLGLYGGNDARVNATIEAAETALRARGARFEKVVYDGAGHGFLRQQAGQEGANRRATEQAWPRTIDFFKQTLVAR